MNHAPHAAAGRAQPRRSACGPVGRRRLAPRWRLRTSTASATCRRRSSLKSSARCAMHARTHACTPRMQHAHASVHACARAQRCCMGQRPDRKPNHACMVGRNLAVRCACCAPPGCSAARGPRQRGGAGDATVGRGQAGDDQHAQEGGPCRLQVGARPPASLCPAYCLRRPRRLWSPGHGALQQLCLAALTCQRAAAQPPNR